MEQRILSNIVQIRFGVSTGIQSQGTVPCIQGKDINESKLLINNLLYLNSDSIKERDYLRKAEILLAGKGKSFAYTWKGELNKAVATATFFILTVQDQSILPDYLCWFLNSDSTKAFFNSQAFGVTVSNISRKSLDQLMVPIPTLEIQEKVVKLDELAKQESKLEVQLQQKRKQYIKTLLLKSVYNN